MKTTASSVVGNVLPKRVLPKRSATVPLPISAWEEDVFVVTVDETSAGRVRRELLDWESIEAIGAADDPARFKIGFQAAELSGVCLKPQP
jgi:hypothetical protein